MTPTDLFFSFICRETSYWQDLFRGTDSQAIGLLCSLPDAEALEATSVTQIPRGSPLGQHKPHTMATALALPEVGVGVLKGLHPPKRGLILRKGVSLEITAEIVGLVGKVLTQAGKWNGQAQASRTRPPGFSSQPCIVLAV